MIYFITFILLFNLVDYFVTRKGGKPNYKIYNSTKAVFGLGIFALHGNFETWQSLLISGVVWAIFEISFFWVLYELVRNLWSRRPLTWRELLYYDQVELDSGGIDKFFAKRWELHAWCKLIALLLAVLSGIIIYHNG